MTRADIDALCAIPDPSERYATALGMFSAARKSAGREIAQSLKDKGLSAALVSDAIGVDAGGFSKRLHGEFTLPPSSLVMLCYTVLGKSVNEVLLGFPGVTMLPRCLSAGLMQLPRKGTGPKVNALKYALELRDVDRAEHRLSRDTPFSQLLRERVQQLADDKGVYPPDICGADAPPTVKGVIKKCIDQDNYVGLINQQLYIAVTNNTTIDGIIAANPVDYTRIALYGSDDIIGDKMLRQIAAIYYDLCAESRAQLVVYLLNQHWLDGGIQ